MGNANSGRRRLYTRKWIHMTDAQIDAIQAVQAKLECKWQHAARTVIAEGIYHLVRDGKVDVKCLAANQADVDTPQ